MKCKRLNEVLELLQPYWSKDPDLSLLQILQKIADEAGFDKPVAELSDEVIIYHLKMHGTDKFEPIPGIKKDYEEDFTCCCNASLFRGNCTTFSSRTW